MMLVEKEFEIQRWHLSQMHLLSYSSKHITHLPSGGEATLLSAGYLHQITSQWDWKNRKKKHSQKTGKLKPA